MKSLLILGFMLFISESMAVCNSPISRTNFSANQVLTSTRLNTEFNTLYTQINELPNEECICFDGKDLNYSDLVDEYVNGKPIYSTKERITFCETPEACRLIINTLCEGLENYESYFAENVTLNGFDAYCIKLTGYEQVKSGKKILKLNQVKKDAYLAKVEARRLGDIKKKEDKILEKESIKAILENPKSMKEMGAALIKYIESKE